MTSPAGMAASAIQASRSRQDGAASVASPCRDARALRNEQARNGDQDSKDRIARRPQLRLASQRQQRLDHDRIGDERGERSEIRGGIEHIRVVRLRMAGGREPGLQQRRARRQHRERQPDGEREQADEPGCDVGRRRHVEAMRDADRQGERGHREHAEMRKRADAERNEAHQQMGIDITRQQRGLEEHHRHRPNRRRAAEPRQHHLCEHRLDGEQQQRGQEQRGRIEERRKPQRAAYGSGGRA